MYPHWTGIWFKSEKSVYFICRSYRIRKTETKVLVEKKAESVTEIRKTDTKTERIVIETRKIAIEMMRTDTRIKKIATGIKRVATRTKMRIKRTATKIGRNATERERKEKRYGLLCNYKGFKSFKWNVHYVGDSVRHQGVQTYRNTSW